MLTAGTNAIRSCEFTWVWRSCILICVCWNIQRFLFIFQTYLDAFTEAANSPYGCLLVKGKVAVATKKWWEFSAVELVLLSLLINSSPACSSRDIPVFLPVSSPTVSTHWSVFVSLTCIQFITKLVKWFQYQNQYPYPYSFRYIFYKKQPYKCKKSRYVYVQCDELACVFQPDNLVPLPRAHVWTTDPTVYSSKTDCMVSLNMPNKCSVAKMPAKMIISWILWIQPIILIWPWISR